MLHGGQHINIFLSKQGSSWFISLGETGAKILFTAIAFYFFWRQKKLRQELASYMGEEMVNQAVDML